MRGLWGQSTGPNIQWFNQLRTLRSSAAKAAARCQEPRREVGAARARERSSPPIGTDDARPRHVVLETIWSAARAGPWWVSWEALQGIAILAGALALDARGERRVALGAYVCAVACACAGGVLLGSAPSLFAWSRGAVASPVVEVAGFGALLGLSAGYAAAFRAMSRARHPSTRAALDRLAPSLGVMIVFARVGCFLGGCDFGAPTAAPWGMRFPAGTPAFRAQVDAGLVAPGAGATLAVHPTPLYEAAVGLFLFALVRALPPGRPGQRFATALAGYAIARLALDTLRGDLAHAAWGLTASQLFSLAALAAVTRIVLAPRRDARPALGR